MADGIVEKVKVDFIQWFVKTYGEDAYNRVFSNGNEQTLAPFWQYYFDNVMDEKSRQDLTVETNRITNQQNIPDSTYTPPKFNLPKEINGRPVNYTLIDTTEVDAGYNELGQPIKKTLYLYAPVFSGIDQTNIQDVYGNIYGVFDDGGTYNEGKPITKEALSSAGYINYDPLSGKVEAPEILKLVQYPSVLQQAIREHGEGLTPDMEVYLKDQVNKGGALDWATIKSELTKFKQYPEYANLLRKTGRLSGDLPELQGTWDKQSAEMPRQALDKPVLSESFTTGTDKSRQQMSNLQAQYDYWKPRFEAGIYNPQSLPDLQSQLGYAVIVAYENAQKQLQSIETGETPETMQGVPQNVTNRITESASNLGLQPNKIVGEARQYIANQENPQYDTLTGEQRKELTSVYQQAAGFDEEGSAAETEANDLAEQKKRWEELTKKAKEAEVQKLRMPSMYPQRQVRI
jgi:hypothetical protein